jgi:hypothetical protein
MLKGHLHSVESLGTVDGHFHGMYEKLHLIVVHVLI